MPKVGMFSGGHRAVVEGELQLRAITWRLVIIIGRRSLIDVFSTFNIVAWHWVLFIWTCANMPKAFGQTQILASSIVDQAWMGRIRTCQKIKFVIFTLTWEWDNWHVIASTPNKIRRIYWKKAVASIYFAGKKLWLLIAGDLHFHFCTILEKMKSYKEYKYHQVQFRLFSSRNASVDIRNVAQKRS